MSALPSSNPSLHAPARRRWPWGGICLGLTLLVLSGYLLGPSGVPVKLAQKTWQRDIEIETRLDDFGSTWCDELPTDARVTQRSSAADPSGQRPGLSAHCRYMAPQWRALHSAHAEGIAPTPPYWPSTALEAPAEPPALGAQRLGKRHERYEVHLRADNGKAWTCRLPLAQWQDLAPELEFRLKVDRFGVANCTSLPLKVAAPA